MLNHYNTVTSSWNAHVLAISFGIVDTEITLDVGRVESMLFAGASAAIMRDYGQRLRAADPTEFCRRVYSQFGYRFVACPYRQIHTPRDVFEAVVKAFGGMGQPLAHFLRKEPGIRKQFLNYEPRNVCLAANSRRMDLRYLSPLFPEVRSVRAMLAWAKRLGNGASSGGEVLVRTADQMLSIEPGLTDTELTLCVACMLAAPPTHLSELKLPGMAYSLAVQLLRNLGWPAFRPTQQISRLFGEWRLSDRIDVQDRLERLVQVIECHGPIAEPDVRRLREFLRLSLLGTAITPEGVQPAYADLLVHMLGMYVMRPETASKSTSPVNEKTRGPRGPLVACDASRGVTGRGNNWLRVC